MKVHAGLEYVYEHDWPKLPYAEIWVIQAAKWRKLIEN